MNIKRLMSGIAVVIDDALNKDGEETADKIFQIIENFENQWEIPFYKANKIPADKICNNLLQSAAFVLLDWKLWPGNASQLQDSGIKANINFLKNAKDYFVPVFIFTNESPDDVINALPPDLYVQDKPEKNFIFIKQKGDLVESEASGSQLIEGWLEKNASVYTLKTWERAFYKSKRELFSSMYTKSPDWPKVFWKSYKDDGVDPNSSMVNLINNILIGRMELDMSGQELDTSETFEINEQDIKSVWEEASFIRKEDLSENSIKAGDLFEKSENSGNYFLNIRADCDCVPRQGQEVGSVELYCIEGKSISQQEIEKLFMKEHGNFHEQVNQAIVFSIHGGKNIRFYFRKLVQKKFSQIENKRVGRITHPYITRIQQRYALYLQRQGLPRIPEQAIETGDDI